MPEVITEWALFTIASARYARYVPQPYSDLAPQSLSSRVVPPTPVTQALVAGHEPDATPLMAAKSPSSPELKSTVTPCAAPAIAAWSYRAWVPGAIDSPLLPQLSVTTSAKWL